MNIETSRRGFLKSVAATGALLVVGLSVDGVWAAGDAAIQMNPFVKISSDGVVTVVLKHFEMGQGTTTGLTTLVAEELDANWQDVQIEFAPADKKRYANLFFGMQGTGGSTAIANSFMQYRKAGATAREILVRAAAQKWGVAEDAITVENGVISSGDHKAHFGEMIDIASKLQPLPDAILKSVDEFKLIGTDKLPRKDSSAKINGSATFAMDVKVKGMVYAAVRRSPKAGGLVVSFDSAQTRQVPGFVDAKTLPDKSGVVVYAKNTWAAFKARDELDVKWDFAKAETRSTAEIRDAHVKLLDNPQYLASKGADLAATAASIDGAKQIIEADFVVPNLAHAPMETLNCVIEATDKGVRVYDGCQMPDITKPTIARILSLDPEKVEIKTVYAGGSFGRRANPTSDYHAEAAMAFDVLGRTKPVKLVWSREDDLAGGYYRPFAAHRVRLGLDSQGGLTGWEHRIASKPITKGTLFESFLVKDGIDHTSVEGVVDTHYKIPNLAVRLSDFESPVKVLWWRSVGHSHTAFVLESAMDMAAHAAGIDPVQFRLNMLPGETADQKRLAAVLKLAVENGNWDKPLPDGRGRGVAVHKSFNSYVALVAEVSIKDGKVSVDKITCAVDCGVAVNPDVIRAQMEGGIGYALGTAMRNEITFTKGVVDQENFPDYEPLRIADMPDIEVHIVKSAQNPTGVGEPGVPPTAPAVANAIFAASGKRITSLPMANNGVDFA